MRHSQQHLSQRRYSERCAERCLKYKAAILPLVQKQCGGNFPPCVVASVALFEMGARSPFERRVERIVYQIGILLARVGLLSGVPDISVGPFQMRPSTAFGWERRRVPFGCVAVPRGASDAEGLARATELCESITAIPLLIKLLAQMPEETASCSALSSIYSRYRGRTLTPSETDYHILMGVHNALHLPAANSS